MKPECLNWCYIFNKPKPNKMSVICKCLKKKFLPSNSKVK